MQMRNGCNNKYMNLGPFHTYLDKNIFESATFFSPYTASFLTYPVLMNPQLFLTALQSGNVWIRYESGIVWTLNADLFFNPVTK